MALTVKGGGNLFAPAEIREQVAARTKGGEHEEIEKEKGNQKQ